MHSVLKGKFVKIYVSIFKFLKEKKVNCFLNINRGNNFKIKPYSRYSSTGED